MAFSSLTRHFLRYAKNEAVVRRITLSCNKFKEDESSKKSLAANKLHSLLQEIVKDESLASDNTAKTTENEIAPKKIKREATIKNLGRQIVESAKEVAKELDGKPEETEAQLLHQLLYKNQPLAESITKSVGNGPLKEMLSGMDVEKQTTTEQMRQQSQQQTNKEFTRADQVRVIMGKKSFKHYKAVRSTENINIFGEKPLGIFPTVDELKETHLLNTWELIEKKELDLLVTHPPSNIYEQMIQWTDRGMLWKFPINNEQGMEEEESSDFSEHIFLENHLEGWCPEKGPIRHFMELVCVGLSRNHWLTVKEKKDHIVWFKDYFLEKRALIKELEAGEIKVIEAN